MDLHIRIFLGYAWLVFWLVVAAAGAALGFNQLGGQLSSGVGTSTRTVQGMLSLLSALDRQEVVVQRALLGERAALEELPNGWKELEQMVAISTAATQADAATGERDLRWSLARYQEAVAELLATGAATPAMAPATASSSAPSTVATPAVVTPPPPPVVALAAPADVHRTIAERVEPQHRAFKVQVNQLLEETLRGTIDREDAVEQTTRRYAVIYGVMLVLVLISAGYVSRSMRRGLVDRLVALAGVAEAVSEGEKHRRATAGPDDELGLIARQFNALLDHEQALKAEMEGRLCQQRQLLLGFVEASPRPIALFTIYGDLTVTNFDEKLRDELIATRFEFPKPASREQEQAFATTFGKKRAIRFRLLRVDGQRPVGWLGEVE